MSAKSHPNFPQQTSCVCPGCLIYLVIVSEVPMCGRHKKDIQKDGVKMAEGKIATEQNTDIKHLSLNCCLLASWLPDKLMCFGVFT